MNQKLKGYRVALGHAHLQLVGGTLTLNELRIIQQAHPRPPIAHIAMMSFQIEWKELLSRRVVADVFLWQPKVHVDRNQFVSEKHDQVPLKQKGWQDALESVYPFKINRFIIEDGDVVYIQDAMSPPLHLARLNFITDNIRNIHAPENTYPSKLHADLVIFGKGRAAIEGYANYLEEPFPGARTRFKVENVPLSAFDPEIRQINIGVRGGRFSSSGVLEYSPKVTRIQVDNATINGINVQYVHLPATQHAETQRINETGKQIERQNNRPAVDLQVREFDVIDGHFSYTDKTKDPAYRIFISQTDVTLTNLSNHQQQGTADIVLHGKFMGSGNTKLAGDFLASRQGPALNMKLAIEHTDLKSMNGILRAYGKFDVAAGDFSLYSQMNVSNGYLNGYVKPMFGGLEVYDYRKDKSTPVLHQAKELLIGGASHLLRNGRTQQVATEVRLSGKVSSPGVSTWQAIGQVLQNAFIQAILPGFERAISPHIASNTQKRPRILPAGVKGQ